MISNNNIIVFDFETSGINPQVDEPVQIAALAIDGRSLEIIDGSKFESLMKPVNIFSGTEKEIDQKWFACQGAWNVNKKTKEQLSKAPLPEHVWKAFANHVKKYDKPGRAGKPIASGHNIQNFDMEFVNVLCKKYNMASKDGKQSIFNTRAILDTINISFLWFENSMEPPDLKMDTLREFLGISKDGAHDAANDVDVSAQILISFMKLFRKLHGKIKFKKAFSND